MLFASGLTLIYGVLKILHIAGAGAFTLAAYSVVFLNILTHNLLLSFVVGPILVSVALPPIFLKLYESMLDGSPLIPLVASVGFYIVMEELFRLAFGPFILGFPFPSMKPVSLGSVTIPFGSISIIAISLPTVLLLWLFLHRTNWGLSLRATASNRRAAEMMGINTRSVVLMTFVIGSILASAGGVLAGIYYGGVSPPFGDNAAVLGLSVIVLGGMGSLSGTIVAGLVLGLASSLTVGLLPFNFPPNGMAFLVLTIILIIRPKGILGGRLV